MKYVLIVTICSFLDNKCPLEMTSNELFNDWSSCMKKGLEVSTKTINNIKEEDITKFKLAPKFMCYEAGNTA